MVLAVEVAAVQMQVEAWVGIWVEPVAEQLLAVPAYWLAAALVPA
jgi:hypothetical protein